VKRIGILGGTFNPIHNGHLAIAQMVAEDFLLDKVIFVPSHVPPHKAAKNLIPAYQRLAMVNLAVKGNSLFTVSDCEIKRSGKSYSIDTVKFLKDQYNPGAKFFFIIGSDMLAKLHTWKEISTLASLVTFIVVSRRGVLNTRAKIKVLYANTIDLEVSSTALRTRLASGKSVKYLLPDNVIAYINKQKFYQ
jgi:nicotinate-nucleotide adenylyltransferase